MEGIIEVSDGSGADGVVCMCGYVYEHLCTYAKSRIRSSSTRARMRVCVGICACTCTRPHVEGTGMVVENADADMRGQSLEAAERGWSAHTYANHIRRCTGF